MRVFIVFRDTIYVSGLRTTLSMAAGVEAVDHAPSIARAWESEALAEADVVVLDSDLGGAMAFVQEIAERLSYSERTIKTILHDIVIRLGVKSRS